MAHSLARGVEDTDMESMTAARSSRSELPTVAVVAGATVVAIVRMAGLVKASAVNLLYQDQWDLMRPLFADDGPWRCFRWQHGPHRQGLGGVINWYLYRATDWDVRAEAWVAVVTLFLASVAAIALAVRLRGRLKWTDAAYPPLLVNPVHWETVLLTPNLAHSVLPVLLVFLLAHAWISRRWVRLAAVAAIDLFCLFTGFGFCAFGASGLLLALLWRASGSVERKVLGWIALLAVLAVVSFGWQYRWEPAVPGWRFPVPNWWDYPRFVALMFSSLVGWRAVSWATVLTGSALAVLVVTACAWSARELWRGKVRSETQVIWLLTATSLIYCAFTAIGRLPVNLEAAFMWRYLTLMIPAIAGLILFAEYGLAQTRIGFQRACAVASFALAGVIWGNFTPERYAAVIAEAKTRWIENYLATHDLSATNQRADFSVYVRDPEAAILTERLRWLEERHLLFFKATPPAIKSAPN
jgi:hypothetical protein